MTESRSSLTPVLHAVPVVEITGKHSPVDDRFLYNVFGKALEHRLLQVCLEIAGKIDINIRPLNRAVIPGIWAGILNRFPVSGNVSGGDVSDNDVPADDMSEGDVSDNGVSGSDVSDSDVSV